MTTLSTGLDALDRKLDGGFTEGSMIALVTPPDTPSYALLQQLMQERPSTVITTLRSASAVETNLEHLMGENVPLSVAEVGNATEESSLLHSFSGSSVYSAETNERERVLDEVFDIIQSIEGCQNLIIDPMNPLERSESREAYQRLLQKSAAALSETNSIGIFHCISSESPPELRETTMTMVDTVWKLGVTAGNKNDLELKTHIPKNRGGNLILEELKLLVDKKTVYTDQSRAI